MCPSQHSCPPLFFRSSLNRNNVKAILTQMSLHMTRNSVLRSWAVYLGVGHSSQAFLREAFRAPAANLLGHLLSTICHPWMAFWDPALRWPVTHKDDLTLVFLNQIIEHQEKTHWQGGTHRLLPVSIIAGGGRALLNPGPPSWEGVGGSTRWNSNGVRFCLRYTTWPLPTIRQTDREMQGKGAEQEKTKEAFV